jgi:hypothetical protein
VATWGRWRAGGPGALSFRKEYHDAHTFHHKVFFQRYFSQKHGKEQVRTAKVDKRKTKCHDSDTESDGVVEGGNSDEDSDPEEEVIWKVGPTGMKCAAWLMESMQAMKASMPKADGDDGDDGDEDDEDDDSLVEYPIHPDEDASSDIEEEPSDAEDDGPADWDGVGLSSSSDASDADESDAVSLDASVPGRNLTYRVRTGWICHASVARFERW